MIVIGIDPGKTGAVAVRGITKFLEVRSLSTMDRPQELHYFLEKWYHVAGDECVPIHIYVEQQWVMPRQGGAVELLTGYGEILTCCRLAGVEPKIITWSAWKKEVLKDYVEYTNPEMRHNEFGKKHCRAKYPKEASIAWCEQHHPDLSLLVTDRCKKPSNDMADAVCIAEYGWRMESKENG